MLIRARLSVEGVPVRIDAAGDAPPREVGDGTYEVQTWTPRLIAVLTDDPRAAVGRILVDLPEQPPSELEVVVPSRSDTRLTPLLVRPVDVESKQPLAGAVLEPGARAPWESPLLANAGGELSVPETLWRRLGWRQLVDAIYVPGHRAALEPLKEPTDKEWRGWAATGRLDVPYARARAGGQIRVRVLDDDGQPVVGALLIPRTSPGSHVGAARTDRDGEVLITGHSDSIRTLLGLRILRPEKVIEGHVVAVPMGPEKGPHRIRLSRRAPVELRLLHAAAEEAGAHFELAVEDDGVAAHGVTLLELEPWLDFLFERDRPVHVRVGADGVARFEARIGARLRVQCREVSARGDLRERGTGAVIEVREGGTSATIDAS